MNDFKAELQGGLGNQLFILTTALSAARRFGLPLELDARAHSSERERPLAISPVLENLNCDVRIVTGRRTFLERVFRVLRIRLKSRKYFVEQGFGFDQTFSSLRSTQILFGYFQSPLYFSEGVAGEVHSALEKQRASLGIHLSTDFHVHIRRGDYLGTSASQVHGLASMEYFERAISRVQAELPSVRFKVFTDSPELIPAETLTRWNAYLEESDDSTPPLTSLLEMSSGQGLIMSNSSFSWWAAWLISQRSPANIIIAPRPWMADGSSAHDLLKPEWLTLGS